MIVAIIIDQQGRPVCSEMWPGNTADVTTLIPVVDRLRSRFGIGGSSLSQVEGSKSSLPAMR
jgi:transposase